MRRLLADRSLDAVIISRLIHIRYLSGFTGSNALLLVTSRKNYLITDSRYTNQAEQEASGCTVVTSRSGLMEEVKRKSYLRNCSRIGFESKYTFHLQLQNYRRFFPGKRWIPLNETVESAMSRKDGRELGRILKSIRIAEASFTAVLPLIKPGVSERDIAAELSYQTRIRGAERDAFDLLIAGGERAALPHGVASGRKIRNNELLLMDFGCVVDGYHSDITRMIAIGKIKAEARKVYTVIREALELAVDVIAPGKICRQVDAVARNHLKRNGYGKYFVHSLGHGIGLDIHELPRLSSISDETLAAGNVVTVEPGVYISGRFGIRLEDDVAVTDNGCEVLTNLSRDLISL